MERLSGEDFFKTLKRFDFDTGSITSESLDWLFDNKETGAILSWLCTYIDENNVETYTESLEYASLSKEEIEVSPEYINNVFSSNPIFSHIQEADVEQINSTKKQIDNAKMKEDHINKLTSKYLSLESSLNSQLRKLQEEDINERIKHQNYISECKIKSKKIDELHKSIDTISAKMHSILSHSNTVQEKQQFFCRIPLDMYISNGNSFITNLNLWIRKNIEVNNANIKNIDINDITSELSRMKNAIEEAMINQVKAECGEKELIARLDYFKKNRHTHYSSDNQKIQEIQLTSRINSLHEDLNKLYSTDLQQSTEKYSMNLINIFLIKNAEIKLNNCKLTLKMLKNINNEIIHSLAQFMLVFLLLKTDKIQFLSIKKFLEDIYFYSSKYLKIYAIRSELMRQIETNVSKQKSISFEAFTLVTEKHSDEPVMNIIREFEKQKVSIENLENKLFVTSNQKYWNTVKEIEQNNKCLRDFIWRGPTMQAELVPYNYLQQLSTANYQLEKVNKVLGSCMDNYTDTRNMMDKNRWLKYRRLLWMLFLMNPTKLNEVINNLKTFVIEQAKSTNCLK